MHQPGNAGTRAGYRKDNCRCDHCRAWAAADRKRQRQGLPPGRTATVRATRPDNRIALPAGHSVVLRAAPQPFRPEPPTEWRAPKARRLPGCPDGYCRACHVVHLPRPRPPLTSGNNREAILSEIKWRVQALGVDLYTFAALADRLRMSEHQAVTYLREMCRQLGRDAPVMSVRARSGTGRR